MPETIGPKLRQAREGRDLTIEQVAGTTRIRPHYLQALERDDLSAIPSSAQARGFLRIYAAFLGLDPDQLVAELKPPEPQAAAPSTSPASDSVQKSAPAPEPARPGFLASLLDRFTRRPDAAAGNEAAASSAVQAAPEPEPFVPARFTEELPADPSSLPEKPVQAEEPGASAVPAPGPKATSRKTTVRRSSPRTARSAESGTGRKTGEKKKIR
jgi:cytoskeleton protein RodZ